MGLTDTPSANRLQIGLYLSLIHIFSHQERILEIADHIVVLSGGKKIADGPREEILPTLLGAEQRCPYCPGGEEACAH